MEKKTTYRPQSRTEIHVHSDGDSLSLFAVAGHKVLGSIVDASDEGLEELIRVSMTLSDILNREFFRRHPEQEADYNAFMERAGKL